MAKKDINIVSYRKGKKGKKQEMVVRGGDQAVVNAIPNDVKSFSVEDPVADLRASYDRIAAKTKKGKACYRARGAQDFEGNPIIVCKGGGKPKGEKAAKSKEKIITPEG